MASHRGNRVLLILASNKKKDYPMRRSLSVLLLTILSLGARAQASFTGEYTNDFNSYVSLATLPTGWTTGGSGGFQSVGNGSSTTGGFYSFVPSSNAADRSLGALHSSSATGYYQVTFTNSTGSTITSLNISYDFEQYRSAGNATGWDVLVNGTANAALSAAGVTSGITTGTPYVLNKSTSLTGLSIAAGTTFTIRWTVNDLSGSDNPVAIDNFKMCVPGAAFSITATNSSPTTEPSPVTLTGSATLGTSPYTYNWSGPSSYSATGTGPIISPSSAATTTGTYTVSVTDAANCTASATTIVTVNPGTGCSGTPISGTASASPASLCVSGTSTLTVAGATSAAGLTYQWQSSTTGAIGTFTNISAATDVIYTTPTITTTTYYRLVTICTSSTLSDTSTITHVTVNPLPTISAPGGSICSGGTGRTITATGASTYSWAPSTGLSATTGATVTANPTNDVTYTVTGTSSAGCVNTTTTTVTYNISPSSLTITPGSLSACMGNAPYLLTATGGVVGPTTVNSGVITIPASIGSNGTISNALTVAGVPAGAVITGASVNLINFGANYSADYVINIKAPNNNVLNLINQKGTATSTVTTLFVNANISSAGASPLSGGSNPFTGTWLADAASSVGGAPNVSNVTDWNSLFSTPNGNWTLSIYNNTTFTNSVLTSAQWSLKLTYSYQAPITWTPTTDLYTDAAGTTPYAGTATTAVYKDPTAPGTITYTALATNNICTVNGIATVTVNPSPGAISGTPTVCQGSTTTFSIGTTGGTWTAAEPTVCSVDVNGVVTGIATGTSAVSYTATTGCVSSVIVTVNGTPATISGTATVCEGATTSLTDATTGGTWSSSNMSIGTIDATTGVATGILAGTTNITYTLGTGCNITAILTVNTTPSAITGTLAICEGVTTTLSSATPSGTWTSTLPAIATIDASGIATGVLAGTSDISYTLATGCFTTATLTVNPLPAAITGTMEVCQGSTTTLADVTTGGTWVTNPVTIAGIDASGIVTGVASGTASVTYTLGTGCINTAIVTVDPLPASVTGTLAVCEGLTTTVSTAGTGGTWTSSDITIAAIDASGVITGSTTGTATITYTLSTGCITTAVATVNPLPGSITGVLTACVGQNTMLTSATSGGTWTSSDITIASASSSTGIITGAAAGTATITYALATGCTTAAIVTINPLPAVIGGTLAVCQGLITTLTDATIGGTWASGTLVNATIDASGVVTAIASGTSIITYALPTSCMATATVTVNAVPAPITGTLSVCQGSTTTLSALAAGGTWSSSLPAVAPIDASGIVTGVSAATTDITYSLPTGCITTATVTVNALPATITGTLTVCEGLTTTLNNVTTGGTWTSGTPANATIDASGVVTGVAAGTTTITYALGSGCTTSTVLTVNALPATITGTAVVCEGNITTLANTTTGGTWVSSSTNASINLAGVMTGITAGTATMTYTLGSGCTAITTVTVNAAPSAISGPSSVCAGNSITLTNTVAGGTWASSNTNASVSTNIITGATAGTATISYTLSDGCFSTTNITINPTPAVIMGLATVCQGLTTTLGDITTGGTWSSNNGNATIGSSNGIVTGALAGTSTISYTLPAGCYITTTATVNPLPTSITGTASVCIAGTTTLSSSAGGTWTSSNGNATIGLSTGIVTGVSAGTSVITYTLSTGCLATRVVTVSSLPGTIISPSAVCIASTITLTSTGGGTWISSNANAVVGSSTGVVMGVTGGTSVITYMLATSCYTTKTITVNPLPAVIGGTAAICVGATTTLTSTPAGTWSTSNTNATIGSSTGIATGVTAGTSVITYSLPTGCYTTRIVTVNPLPGAITGTTTVCAGSQTTLTDAGGGTWSSGSANVSVAATSGIVTGVTAGTATVTYTLATGCTTTTNITVNALPSVFAVTGGGSYCAGGAGLPIGLSNSTTGINYQLYQGTTAAGTVVAGTGTLLSMGTYTTAGTYTVAATNATTGCAAELSGSAMIVINPLLTPSINISAPTSDTVCSGILTTFSADTANAGSAPVYQWAINGSVVGSTSTYSYTPADGDVLSLKLTSNATCATPDTATDTTNLTVITSVTPSVTFAATPGLHVCAGTLVTFSATPVNGGSTPAYRWTQNGINVATGPTYTIAPENGDNVYCTLFSNQLCRTNDSIISPTSTLTVDSPGTLPVVSIAAHPGLTITAGQSDTLIATATGIVSYQWLVNGLPIAGATDNSYVSNSFANNDTVTCVVTKNTVCAESNATHAVINVTSGIPGTTAENALTIMPNPNNGRFSVAGSVAGDGEVQFAVTNLLGQCVYTQNAQSKSGRVDAQVQLPQSLSDGTYLVTVRIGNMVSTHRIVVSKQ
jgi:uncharacterized protein YjdB